MPGLPWDTWVVRELLLTKPLGVCFEGGPRRRRRVVGRHPRETERGWIITDLAEKEELRPSPRPRGGRAPAVAQRAAASLRRARAIAPPSAPILLAEELRPSPALRGGRAPAVESVWAYFESNALILPADFLTYSARGRWSGSPH